MRRLLYGPVDSQGIRLSHATLPPSPRPWGALPVSGPRTPHARPARSARTCEGCGFGLSFVCACCAGPSNLLPASLRSLHCTREWPRSVRRGRTSRDPQRSTDMKAAVAKKIADQALQNLTDAFKSGKSERITQYLAMLAKFHRYSFGSVVLILSRMPAASRPAVS